MAFINRALTALKRIFIVIGIALAFSFGLIGAIVLSLRSSETKVPDIVGKDRLAAEKSPYLLQHQHNPVDWYAWGDDAFKKARAENKPIFLSIASCIT